MKRASKQAHYRANTELAFTNYIYRQDCGHASRVLMGVGNGKYNGCGWIATYNAIKKAGNYAKPADIVQYYEEHGCILRGRFGINPFSVKRALKHFGVKSKFHINLRNKKLDSKVKSFFAAIVLFAHKKGAHYFMVQWVESRQKFVTYNLFCCNRSREYDSLQAVFKDNGFHCLAVTNVFSNEAPADIMA